MSEPLFTPGGVHELRIVKAGRLRTISGYFDTPGTLTAAAMQLDQAGHPGVYMTLNPCNPALLARCANRAEPYADVTTSDHDIDRRRWLPIDLDPVRPAKIPSTDVEHAAAMERAAVIAAHLGGLGWPVPVIIDSGNGAYLLYRVDLPNDEPADTLMQRCLQALAGKFDDTVVTVDQTMHNAARIVRVPGTTNRKGSGSPDRPHRQSRLLHAPAVVDVVTVDQLTALAADAPATTSPRSAAPTPAQFMAPGGGVDVAGFVAQHFPDARQKSGRDLWEIPVCPFNPDHANHEAYIGRMSSGAAYAGCHHNSCTWAWQDLRDRFQPRPARVDQAQLIRDILGPTGEPATKQRTAEPAGEGMYDTDDLDVTNEGTAADWLRAAVGRGRLAGLFDRTGQIVLIAREGEAGYVPAKDGDHDGPAQVRTINNGGQLAAYIDARFRCYKFVKNGDDWDTKPALFPLQSSIRIVDLPDPTLRPGLRQLAGVTHTPVVRADGTILDTPGYDQATRLYYLPDPGLTVPPVPDQPTPDQVRRAVALLDEMTGGFPWKSEHDRANYYGFLLTPLLRACTPPPYKLFIFDAPQQGTGKTLLAELGRALHGGVLRGGMAHTDDAETRKVITSVLIRTTGVVIVLDNLTGTLDSPVLAGLLTSPDWADRVLGATEEAHVPNDRLWCATANNLSIGPDMVRRVVWVGIDAQMSRPQDRTGFAITDLPGWTRDHRGDLLHALLVLVRAWVTADRPAPAARTSDSFARWARTLDGILTHAGVPGRFADPSTERETVSSDDDEWGRFLAAAYASFGDQSWTAKELLTRVPTTPAPPFGEPTTVIPTDALPGDLAEKALRHAQGAVGVARSLGMWLNNRDGRFVGALAAKHVPGGRGGIKRWRVVQNPTASSGGTEGTGGTSHPQLTRGRYEPTTESSDSGPSSPVTGLVSPPSPLSPTTFVPPAPPTGYAPVLPQFPPAAAPAGCCGSTPPGGGTPNPPGSDVTPSCGLCPKSPTYWRNKS